MKWKQTCQVTRISQLPNQRPASRFLNLYILVQILSERKRKARWSLNLQKKNFCLKIYKSQNRLMV